MKVLFTDIDGVLNCRRTPNPRKLPYVVDQELLARFRRMLDATGARVVLSSTWRHDPAGLFSARHWGIPFDGVVPDMPGQPRRDEILAWLAANPAVTRYAVLDDECDELDDLPLFQPSGRTGVTEEIAAALIGYLNGETDQDLRRNALVRAYQNLVACMKSHEG